MADVFSRSKRSWIMARIRGTDTAPEIFVRTLLRRAGFKFRVHCAELPGRPDIVLPRHRTAIFVNGCFWHSHSCQRGRIPRSNRTYWEKKLARNASRDKLNAVQLKKLGWKRVVVWACEIDHNWVMRRLRK